MSKALRLVLAVGVVVTIGLAVSLSGNSTPAQEADARPNIVFVMADDARADDLARMPNIGSLVADQGATFDNFYVTTSLCCPSRSTILTGEYVHNHGVHGNSPPNGGYQTFREEGHEQRTIAAHLGPSGYANGLFGKFLNHYGLKTDSERHVPPHWDRWFAMAGGKYYDWDASDDGELKHFGNANSDYGTSVYERKARSWIAEQEAGPFFAYVAPNAPHAPYTEPPNHQSEFAGEQAPRNPNFDEEDVSDKPDYIPGARLSESEEGDIDQRYRKRLRMLLAVDDMVKGIVDDLHAAGELENTYIFVTSDNGWMQGEHRISEKKTVPYEESMKVPLYVRGPGIAPGTRIPELAANTDFYPTFAEIAGTPHARDGRSLLPLLRGESPPWRNQILLESLQGGEDRVPNFFGVRTGGQKKEKYVEYSTGERELYDLDADPYELDNLYDTADPALLSDLQARLDALKTCAGESCRAAEDGS